MAFPESGPLVENAPPEFEVRSFLIRKFQHEIIVAVVKGVRTIVAIAPTKREPEYWLERLERIEEG